MQDYIHSFVLGMLGGSVTWFLDWALIKALRINKAAADRLIAVQKVQIEQQQKMIEVLREGKK